MQRAPAAVAVIIASLMVGSCGREDISYFPVGRGTHWQYAITVKTTERVKQGRLLIAGMPASTWQGQRVYASHLNDGTTYLYSLGTDGIRRVGVRKAGKAEVIADPPGNYVLPFPLITGASWEQKTTTGVLEATVLASGHALSLKVPVELTYRIESVDDEVRVPAGTFRGCLRVRGAGRTVYQGDNWVLTSDVAVDHVDWYAPGVGLVRSQRVETTSSNVVPRGDYLLELLSFERG
ncbi:MAG: hypothetical protein ACT4NU_11675 [Chromatiales bacterium]